MMRFSSSVILALVLMLTSSRTTINTNKNTVTSSTTTFTPMYVAAAASKIKTTDECIYVLTKFAVCLPYISSNPNNLTTEETPPASCCDNYISDELEGSSICFCHFINEPSILGEPVNMTRIYELSTVCPFDISQYQGPLNARCKAFMPNLTHLGSILAPPRSPSESNGSRSEDEAPTNSPASSPTNRDIGSKN